MSTLAVVAVFFVFYGFVHCIFVEFCVLWSFIYYKGFIACSDVFLRVLCY